MNYLKNKTETSRADCSATTTNIFKYFNHNNLTQCQQCHPEAGYNWIISASIFIDLLQGDIISSNSDNVIKNNINSKCDL